MFNRIPREFWISLISIIITAIMSHYIPKLLEVNSIELEFFERKKSEYINIPELLNGRVKILVDDIPQKNLTSTDILLFNRSHKDLKEFPITFEFESPEPSKPIQLLSKQLSAPENFPKDTIEEITQKDENSVRYMLKSFPKDNDDSTDFVASFVFLGDIAPKVRIQSDFSDGKVVDIYEYDQSRRDKKAFLILLAISLPLAALVLLYLSWQAKRDKKRIRTRIINEADDLIDKDEQLSDIREKIKSVVLESYERTVGRKPRKVEASEGES